MPLLDRPHCCANFMTVRCNQISPSRSGCTLSSASFKKDLLIWEQNRNAKQNDPKSVLKSPISKRYVPFTDRNSKKAVSNHKFGNNIFHSHENSDQNGAKCPIVEQTVPFTNGYSEQSSPK